MNKFLKFLFIVGGIILIILIILSVSQEKRKPVELSPSELSKEYSKNLISQISNLGLKTIKLGETRRIIQIGSFVNENSPFYLTIEDYKEGQNFDSSVGKFKTSEENRIIYLKAKLEKRAGEIGLMYDLIKYRIIGRACNFEKKICYEAWDRQDPGLESIEKEQKKNLATRDYYLLTTVPKDEKIDTIILSHLSFGKGGFPPLGPAQTNEFPLAQFKIK